MFLPLFYCFLLCFGSISARESVLATTQAATVEDTTVLGPRISRSARGLSQSEGEGCQLDESQVAEWYQQRDATWTITEDVLDAVDSDLQRIVNCANADDTLLFETSRLIQPTWEILVEKSLTFKGQEGSRARFTCPTREGIFRISDAVVHFENVLIRDCVLGGLDEDRSAVVVTGCGSSVTFQDVVFRNNEHISSPSILNMQTSECAFIRMNRIRIRNNRCSSCLLLSGNVSISDIDMTGNQNAIGSDNNPVFKIHDTTQAEIEGVRFRNNHVGAFTFEDSSFMISDSLFVDNELDFPWEESFTSRGIMTLRVSSGTIQNCRFERNRNPLRSGSTILHLEGPLSLTVSDSVFIDNRVDEANGVMNTDERISVSMTNVSFIGNFAGQGVGVLALLTSDFIGSAVIFENNVGNSAGAVGFSLGSSFLCQGCLFKNNSGIYDGGAISGALNNRGQFAAQLEDCEFISNTADVGGAVSFQGRELPSDFAYNSIDDLGSLYVLINCTFQNNTARLDGGAILAQDPPAIRVQCSPREIPVEAKMNFISVEEFEQLEVIDANNTCETWTDNTAAEGMFGQTVASYAQRLIVRLNGSDSVPETDLKIQGIVSGEVLPVIEAIGVDHNNQGPSVFYSYSSSYRVTITSIDGIVDETQARLENGRAVFTDISTLESVPTGTHTLEASVNDPDIPSVSFVVEIVDG